MTKKEFRKLLKKEGDISLKLMNIGCIFACVSLLSVIIIYLFCQNTLVFKFPAQIICYFIAVIIALIGLCLDVIGEVKFAKKYSEYLRK